MRAICRDVSSPSEMLPMCCCGSSSEDNAAGGNRCVLGAATSAAAATTGGAGFSTSTTAHTTPATSTPVATTPTPTRSHGGSTSQQTSTHHNHHHHHPHHHYDHPWASFAAAMDVAGGPLLRGTLVRHLELGAMEKTETAQLVADAVAVLSHYGPSFGIDINAEHGVRLRASLMTLLSSMGAVRAILVLAHKVPGFARQLFVEHGGRLTHTLVSMMVGQEYLAPNDMEVVLHAISSYAERCPNLIYAMEAVRGPRVRARVVELITDPSDSLALAAVHFLGRVASRSQAFAHNLDREEGDLIRTRLVTLMQRCGVHAPLTTGTTTTTITTGDKNNNNHDKNSTTTMAMMMMMSEGAATANGGHTHNNNNNNKKKDNHNNNHNHKDSTAAVVIAWTIASLTLNIPSFASSMETQHGPGVAEGLVNLLCTSPDGPSTLIDRTQAAQTLAVVTDKASPAYADLLDRKYGSPTRARLMALLTGSSSSPTTTAAASAGGGGDGRNDIWLRSRGIAVQAIAKLAEKSPSFAQNLEREYGETLRLALVQLVSGAGSVARPPSATTAGPTNCPLFQYQQKLLALAVRTKAPPVPCWTPEPRGIAEWKSVILKLFRTVCAYSPTNPHTALLVQHVSNLSSVLEPLSEVEELQGSIQSDDEFARGNACLAIAALSTHIPSFAHTVHTQHSSQIWGGVGLGVREGKATLTRAQSATAVCALVNAEAGFVITGCAGENSVVDEDVVGAGGKREHSSQDEDGALGKRHRHQASFTWFRGQV